MQHLAAYIKEIEDFDSIVMDIGFASYRISGDECYIRDIWINPDYRKSGVASSIADRIAEIAKQQGCKFLTGSVSINIKDPTTSAKVLLAYGFAIHSLLPNGIVFRKELA